ncbi:MAG: radical SAM protein [Sedimentisphaerales bacterium]|nr:radical SAM protein [Sedimentisphaerales bacterium]
MKVLLVWPVAPRAAWPRGLYRVRTFETRLACAATLLRRAGHEVRILQREEQLIKRRFDWEEAEAQLRALLEEFRPDMVAQSVATPAMPEAAQIARWAKEIVGLQAINILAGTHPSGVSERTLAESPETDAVALGEYEQTLCDVADRGLEVDVPGLMLRRGGELIRTPARTAATDPDVLGPPAYDLLDMDFHAAPNPWTIRYLNLSSINVRTSRGCPNRCTFCAEHLVNDVGVRFHSLDYVMDQVRYAADHLGVQAVYFEDDTLATDRERLLTLCESLRREGLHERLRWNCLMRVDQADAEVLAAMKAAGCIQIEYGFESGSDASLRGLAKNTTVEQNRRAVRLTREAGIRIFADIIVGLPGETRADFAGTMKFLQWARPEILSAGRLLPMPGTRLYRSLDESVRATLDWGGFSYTPQPGFRINFTPMKDDLFERLYDDFYKYIVKPHNARALLRDRGLTDEASRDGFHRYLRRFARRHPLRVLRLPIAGAASTG